MDCTREDFEEFVQGLKPADKCKKLLEELEEARNASSVVSGGIDDLRFMMRVDIVLARYAELKYGSYEQMLSENSSPKEALEGGWKFPTAFRQFERIFSAYKDREKLGFGSREYRVLGSLLRVHKVKLSR